MLSNIIDRIKLPFRKEKELYLSLYNIIGVYPHDISLYKLALMHKSLFKRNAKGKPVNNERLEFLGDAVLDAAVGDIVYRHFPGKREGFLTNTRSKLVQRETLNRLAQEMGITQLILSNGRSSAHNSYMGGNAFEALVGALYLDRGYNACMRFIQKRILDQMINIDKVAYKEVNFKSKLIEWAQKNRVKIEFALKEQHKDKNGSPVFTYMVVLEGVEGCDATGYSKKESQQMASKRTLEKLRKQPQFLDSVFTAKTNRTKMEEEPVENVPSTEPEDFIVVNHGGVQDDNFAASGSDASVSAASNASAKKSYGSEGAASDGASSDGSEPSDNADGEGLKSKKRTNRRSPMYAAKAAAAVAPAAVADTEAGWCNESVAEEELTAAEGDAYADASDADASNGYADASDSSSDDEFDLSDITTRDKTREEIIAAAEGAAFEEAEKA